jgi:hypothetical protein
MKCVDCTETFDTPDPGNKCPHCGAKLSTLAVMEGLRNRAPEPSSVEVSTDATALVEDADAEVGFGTIADGEPARPSSAERDEPNADAADRPKVVPKAGRGTSETVETPRVSATDKDQIERCLEHLEANPDVDVTITVIGLGNVGKSFFIDKVLDLAPRHHYDTVESYCPADPTLDYKSYVEGKVNGRGSLKAGKRLDVSTLIWMHELSGTADKSLRIIDLPGEYFMRSDAKRQVADLAAVDKERVALIHPPLAAADAVIFVTPAPDMFPAKPEAVHLAKELFRQIRISCNLTDARLNKGDLRERVTTFLEMTRIERRRRMQALADPAGKPLLVLLSKTDSCLGFRWSKRKAPGQHPTLDERDPMASLALAAPDVVAAARKSFTDFSVDFVTAFEGCKPENKLIAGGEPSIGVWQPIDWLLMRTAKSRTAARVDRRRPTAWLDLILRGRMDPALDRRDDWIIDMRLKGDPEFRARIEGGTA